MVRFFNASPNKQERVGLFGKLKLSLGGREATGVLTVS